MPSVARRSRDGQPGRRTRSFDSIATCALRRIERCVRAPDEFGNALAAVPGRHPYRTRLPMGSRGTHALGDPARRAKVGVGQERSELVSSESGEQVAGAERAPPGSGCSAEKLVACLVAVRVIELL